MLSELWGALSDSAVACYLSFSSFGIGGRWAQIYSLGLWRQSCPSHISGVSSTWSWSLDDGEASSSKASFQKRTGMNAPDQMGRTIQSVSAVRAVWCWSLESYSGELRAAHRACPDVWAALPKLWPQWRGEGCTSSFRMSVAPGQPWMEKTAALGPGPSATDTLSSSLLIYIWLPA